jgi:hypothetical protein
MLAAGWVLLLGTLCQAGETLYNGIVLPDEWPPQAKWEDIQAGKVPDDPPYLKQPPAVIPIDVGRQLFVDDFLVESSTLEKQHHRLEYYPGNPLIRGMAGCLWYVPGDNAFKAMIRIPYRSGIKWLYSKDGIHFDPNSPQDVRNVVLPSDPSDPGGDTMSTNCLVDLQDANPAHRYKLAYPYLYRPAGRCQYWFRFSPDGLHWSNAIESNADTGDASLSFLNPFRKVVVLSQRHGWGKPRARRYWEVHELGVDPLWHKPETNAPFWLGADKLDEPRADYQLPAQLYDFEAIGYESLMVGWLAIWRGEPSWRSKPDELCIGYSRDGWHFTRPDRKAFAPVIEQVGKWNYMNVRSIAGSTVIVGDKLYIYVTGRGDSTHTAMGTIRRDGFVSVGAGVTGGELVTRPVKFSGKGLFVNLEAPRGELRVEVQDELGKPIPGFTRDECQPVRGDKTLLPITWRKNKDLSKLAGKPVRFRFSLANGQLYAFWVSRDQSGRSDGYVAAGGLGFTGPTDTVGLAAYAAAAAPPAPKTAPAPQLWPVDGNYVGKVKVSLALPLCRATDGAVIRYTLNGSEPESTSTAYLEPITLTSSATLKARTFAKGLAPSAVAAGNFTVQADTTSPLVYAAAPNDILPEGTTKVILRVLTDKVAECRCAKRDGLSFDEMRNVLTTSDGCVHETVLTNVKPGELARYYVRARDESGNVSKDCYEVWYYVAKEGDNWPRYRITGRDPEKADPVYEHAAPFEAWKQELEAESAEVEAPMAVKADEKASGGKYIASSEKERGVARLTFTVPADGEYIIWERVIGDADKDSVFVAVDNGAEDVNDVGGGSAVKSWSWHPIYGRDSRGPGCLNPRRFALTKGEHTLVIRGRKVGVQIDKFIITNDRLFKPE